MMSDPKNNQIALTVKRANNSAAGSGTFFLMYFFSVYSREFSTNLIHGRR